MMLKAAAAVIGEHFGEIRDLIGGRRLWALGEAAHKLRDSGAFRPFWIAFGAGVKSMPCVPDVRKEWRAPEVCRLPEAVPDAELEALSSIGIYLLHPDVRSYWTVLSAKGAAQLRLSHVVDAMQTAGTAKISTVHPGIEALWSAIW